MAILLLAGDAVDIKRHDVLLHPLPVQLRVAATLECIQPTQRALPGPNERARAAGRVPQVQLGYLRATPVLESLSGQARQQFGHFRLGVVRCAFFPVADQPLP